MFPAGFNANGALLSKSVGVGSRARDPSGGLLCGFWGWDFLEPGAAELGWEAGVRSLVGCCRGLSAPLAPCEVGDVHLGNRGTADENHALALVKALGYSAIQSVLLGAARTFPLTNVGKL